MKNLMVRTHTFTMLTSRLVVMVLFAALLSAAPFRAALAQNAPDLGTAADFAVLGGTAVTATDSVVIGDVGVDLGGAVTQTNSTITGTVHVGDTAAQQAYDDFIAAYDALAIEQCDTVLTVLSRQTLQPGVYCVSAAATETGGVLTLDGSSTDTWIFKIGTSGTGALTGTNFSVVMTSGETCNNNVFWWTAEAATLTDSVFIGSILAGTSITVTRGSLDGQALAKVAVTLTGTDVSVGGTTVPTVSFTHPSDGATSVALNNETAVTFNKAMDPSTIKKSTFKLKQGKKSVSGKVTCVGVTAIFKPARKLKPNTEYTATITTGAKDLAGNARASDKVWSFTTVTTVAAGPQPVDLGTAGNFVILTKTGITTTGATAVVGDMGVSPIAATGITGFGLILNASNEFSTSSLVHGKIYAADYAPPTPAKMTTAVSDMETAFTDAAGRTLPDATELGAGDISGMTLAPGLYKWGTGVLITSGVTLSGGANDVWIFQIAGDLTVSNSAIVTLIGALPKNIFWQVSGQATLGTTADFKGIILSQTLISLNTGAVMNGRALAQTAVTLNANTITEPNGAAPDTTAPTVSSTDPANAATGVALNQQVAATFSESMDPLTITTATFTLTQGTTPVSGAVTYAGVTATFAPASNLTASTTYTATITTGARDLAGNPLASDKVWSFTTGTAPDTTAPTVSSTDPANGATGVALNKQVAATFSESMDPLTITTATFTLTQGTTPVSGAVTYAGVTATFTPASSFDPSTEYTVTITTGAKDLAGNALAVDKVWSFTTGAAPDTTAPTVSSTDPANGDTGVALSKRVSATFSETMDPLTITNVNFTLTDGVTPATGTVAYVGLTATFTPDNYLASNTTYTATITTVAKDLAGNALASDKVWSFTTLTTVAAGPQPVDLGTAGNFVILAKSGVSTTGTTSIVGDIGVSPIAATAITGFGLIMDSTNTFSTSSLVTGKVYAADYAPPTPANMTTAVSDMETAFTDAAGRTLPDATELGAGDISGMTLAPGLYKWGTGVLITSAGVTLSGGANDVWIFQIAQDLTVSNSAIVTLSGGAQAKNIFWQVSGQATLGTAADFKGIILSQTLISLNTSAVMNGRALAQTAVTLIANTITKPD